MMAAGGRLAGPWIFLYRRTGDHPETPREGIAEFWWVTKALRKRTPPAARRSMLGDLNHGETRWLTLLALDHAHRVPVLGVG